MKNDIESQFEYTKEHLKLSASEKDIHRAKLVAFMQTTRKPVLSPYGTFFSASMRYALVAMLVLGISGTGIAFAAEDSLPDSPLYLVKIKIAEPVLVTLTFDPKEKAEFEVELVNRRLKEFAQASVQGNLDSESLTLVTDSLAEHIDNAQENIAAFHKDQNTDDAFETASDLSSTLSSHAEILERVQASNPSAAEDIEALSATVDEEYAETESLVDTTEDSVEASTEASLDVPSEDQEDDTLEALEKVKADISDALSTLNAEDQAFLDASLVRINDTIAQADAEDAAGNSKAAYLLYSEADQMITELTTMIEADQELGIGIIGTTPEEET